MHADPKPVMTQNPTEPLPLFPDPRRIVVGDAVQSEGVASPLPEPDHDLLGGSRGIR